jgi:hypothetical protein
MHGNSPFWLRKGEDRKVKLHDKHYIDYIILFIFQFSTYIIKNSYQIRKIPDTDSQHKRIVIVLVIGLPGHLLREY